MGKSEYRIFILLCVSISMPFSLYGGPRFPKKVARAKTRYITVGPDVPGHILAPSVLSKEVHESISLTAPVKGRSFSAMEEAVRKAMQQPPLLSLSLELRGDTPVAVLPNEELRRYLMYAIPLAPLSIVYQKVRVLQSSVANEENFFLETVNTYYAVHFSLFTPHVLELHKRINALNDPATEQSYLTRLEQLVARKDQLARTFNKSMDSAQLRIRYLQDIDTITPENFNPDDLVLSVEQRMTPSLKKSLFGHLSGQTKIRIKHQPYDIYRFKGPADHLFEFYMFLVNGNYLNNRMSLTIDRARRSLFLYNFDESVWLRVTPHEYASAKRLHVHVNKIVPFTFLEEDKFVQDRVLLNLSVPVEPPKRLPDNIDHTLQFLFFEQPAQQLAALPRVTVTVK